MVHSQQNHPSSMTYVISYNSDWALHVEKYLSLGTYLGLPEYSALGN